MTRRELLTARSNDVVEKSLKEGVCLGERECLIVREAVLFALLEVERECLDRMEQHFSQFSTFETLAILTWCRDQKESL